MNQRDGSPGFIGSSKVFGFKAKPGEPSLWFARLTLAALMQNTNSQDVERDTVCSITSLSCYIGEICAKIG